MITRIFETTLLAAATLALGCANQSATTRSAEPVDAAIVTITPEGSYLTTLDVETHYVYGYDYDNDGSYVAMYGYQDDPEFDPEMAERKHGYAYDHDDDGGHTDLHAFEANPEFDPEMAERKYPYAFDYDNDGGYTSMHSFSAPRWDVEGSRWEYGYRYDHDGDGSYAQQIPEPEPEPEPEPVTVVEEVILVPFMLDAALIEACTNVEPTFYFAFDSAKLPEDVDEDLTSLVDCLQHDLMSDAEIEVVGHADLRGPESYNDELGEDRAESVAQALQEHGLSDARIEVISMGEEAAEEPMHWDDRRVVIRLK